MKRKIDKLYKRDRENLMLEIAAAMPSKPSVTINFWTGCDGSSFMAQLEFSRVACYFLRTPHTAINIRNCFEYELDSCGISA